MIALILIIGASVSSGWSGTPSGELAAAYLNIPFRNEARICNRLSETMLAQIEFNSLVVNLDASYWDSYAMDCSKPIAAVKDFYAKAQGSRVVIATVPDRNAGGFYRFVCGAASETQACRVPINAAIREGCVGDCLLMDADELYKGRENDDIHLTPQDWKDVAAQIIDRLRR